MVFRIYQFTKQSAIFCNDLQLQNAIASLRQIYWHSFVLGDCIIVILHSQMLCKSECGVYHFFVRCCTVLIYGNFILFLKPKVTLWKKSALGRPLVYTRKKMFPFFSSLLFLEYFLFQSSEGLSGGKKLCRQYSTAAAEKMCCT